VPFPEQPVAGRKGLFVVSYRTFRNTDPPALAKPLERGPHRTQRHQALGPVLPSNISSFSKPYFDRRDRGSSSLSRPTSWLVLRTPALPPRRPRAGLAKGAGVLSLIAVTAVASASWASAPVCCSAARLTLRTAGATTLKAGEMFPHNPFYFGRYGGSESARCASKGEKGRRSLPDPARLPSGTNLPRPPARPARFAQCRGPRASPPCVVVSSSWPSRGSGDHELVARMRARLVELHDFCLRKKTTGEPVARASVWEMEGYSRSWNERRPGAGGTERGGRTCAARVLPVSSSPRRFATCRISISAWWRCKCRKRRRRC